MSRPAVSVVMPFAGDLAAARAAVRTLVALDTRAGDELILADNSGVLDAVDGIRVVRATGERSPAHARNVGAEHVQCDWILFLDADCRAPSGLIDAYFRPPIDADVGAVAGEVAPAEEGTTVAARYGAARSFLGQAAHLSHPYLPRAAAANLLVRRRAFEALGGFYEGLRAAEDTDFSWRLQRAGWRLELRPEACVEHRYRTTLPGLTRQWRGYAAGRAWLARRYTDFEPQPALRRAGARALGRLISSRAPNGGPTPSRPMPAGSSAPARGRLQCGGFLALDALLGAHELAGLTLSNRPRVQRDWRGPARVVLFADRFPVCGDPLVELARTLAGARVEAVARPEAFNQRVARELAVDYREDDGAAVRLAALLRLLARHPLRCALDRLTRRPGNPKLVSLAPAVLRLAADPQARVRALGGDGARAAARRVTMLAGRPPEDADS